jgi:hypothetical protein|tara:strand:- start:5724 stop:6419 length:696 start_codon:yes stop_codon:yes gene_type:complete
MGVMHKKSIAKNHLSEAAKEGRYGDNILVHMNKDEAAVLAKSAGIEKLPINPKTGLPEAFIFAAAGLALGAYGAWKGGKEQSQQASTQSKLMGQQQKEIDEALGSLDGVKSSKEEVAKQEYGQALGNLSMQTGQSKEDLQQNYESMIQKSGMATAGSATTKKSQMYKRIQNQFGAGSNSLLGNLGKSMAGVEEWYEGEKSRLTSSKKRIGLQKNLADKQSGSWYLGKNIFG